MSDQSLVNSGRPAVAITSTVLTVWRFAANVRTWAESQVVDMAVQYGSSS
ncbi:MAG: hypothetical protein ABSA91_00670 [Acidimicrobiales bacterium]